MTDIWQYMRSAADREVQQDLSIILDLMWNGKYAEADTYLREESALMDAYDGNLDEEDIAEFLSVAQCEAGQCAKSGGKRRPGTRAEQEYHL